MTKKELKEIVKEFLNGRLTKGDRIVDWDIETSLMYGQHLVNVIVVSAYHSVYRCEMWVDPIKQEVVEHDLFQNLS